MKESEQNLRDELGELHRVNKYMNYGSPGRRDRERCREMILRNNSHKLPKFEEDTQIQEVLQTPSKTN